MTIYKVQDENGKIHKIEGPEGVSESEILAFAERQLYGGQPQEEQEETAGFFEGLAGGTKRYLSGIKTGVKTPFTSGEEEAVAGIERQRNITEASGTSLDNVKKAYNESGVIGAVGEGLSQVPGALGEQIPVLASIGGGQAIGSAIATGFARGLALPLPPQLKIAAGLIGGMIAPFLSMAGSNMERKAEEDIKAGRPVDVNEMTAYATATLQAATERVGLAYSGISRVLGFSLAKGGTKAAEKLARKNIAAALATGAGKLAVVEGSTEATQQMLERYYAGLSITDEEAQKEYLESAYAAALLFPLGSYQRVSEVSGARKEVKEIKSKEAKEKLIALQAQEEVEDKEAEKSINEEVDDIIKKAEAEIAGSDPLGDKFSEAQLKKQLNLRGNQIPYKSLKVLDLTNLGQLQQAEVILTTALAAKSEQINKKAAKAFRTKIRKKIKLKELEAKAKKPIKEGTPNVDVIEEAIVDPVVDEGRLGTSLKPTVGKKSTFFLSDGTTEEVEVLRISPDGKIIIVRDEKGKESIVDYAKYSTTNPLDPSFEIEGFELKPGVFSFRADSVTDAQLDVLVTRLKKKIKAQQAKKMPGVATYERQLNALKAERNRRVGKKEKPTQGDLFDPVVDEAIVDPVVDEAIVAPKVASATEQAPVKNTKFIEAKTGSTKESRQTAPAYTDPNTGEVYAQRYNELNKRMEYAQAPINSSDSSKNFFSFVPVNTTRIPKTNKSKYKISKSGKLKPEIVEYVNDMLENYIPKNLNINTKGLKIEELDRNLQDKILNFIETDYKNLAGYIKEENKESKTRTTKREIYDGVFSQISGQSDIENTFISDEISNTLKDLAPTTQEVQDDTQKTGERTVSGPKSTGSGSATLVDGGSKDAERTSTLVRDAVADSESTSRGATSTAGGVDPALVGTSVKVVQETAPGNAEVIEGTYIEEKGQALIKYEEANGVTRYRPIQDNATITKLKEEFDFSKRTPSFKDKKIVISLSKAKTFGQVLSTLETKFSKSLTKAQRELLPLIMNTPNVANTKFKVSSKLEKEEGAYGSYSVQDNLIEISNNADIETILHEGTHAATTKTINKHINKDGEAKTRIGREIIQLYNDALAADTENEFTKKLKNPKEFVTEAINNESFQKFLAKVPSSVSRSAAIDESQYASTLKQQGVSEATIDSLVKERRVNNESPSVWSGFVSAVKDMLGMDSINHYVLNDVLALAPSLFEGPGTKPGIQEEKLYSEKDAPTQEELEEKVQRLKQPSEIKLKAEEEIKKEIEETNEIVSIWDKLGTSIFSFDAALNNKVKRELMKGKDTDWESISKTLNEMSVSQVLHVEGVIEEFLKFGRIKYNAEVGKFEVLDEGNSSFAKVMESLKSLATKSKIKLETMREAADKNFKARRAQGFIDNNNIIKAQMNALVKQGKREEAKALGKENLVKVLLTQDQIDEALELSDTYPELNDIHDMWIESKNNAIEFLVATEIMTQEQANEFSMVVDIEGAPEQTIEKNEDGSYVDTFVPFYGKITNKKPAADQRTRLGDRGKYYRLRGTYKPVDDVFANMELWMRSSLKRGMLNKKALDKIKAVELLPQAVQDTIMKIGKDVDRSSSNTVAVSRVRDGVRRVEYYEFADPFYAQAFNGMERAQIDGMLFLSNFSNFLRSNIVLYPLFSLAQLPQDSVSAMFSSGVKYPFMIPVRVVKEFALTLLGMSKSHEDLKKFGAVGFTGSYSQADTDAKGEIQQDGFYNQWSEKIRSNPAGDASLTFLNRIAMASDNAVRQAVYEQTMSETNNPRLAMERAFEVINFKRAGSNNAVTLLRQVVPFFGAYLQAASVQGRVLTGRGLTPQSRAQGFKQLALTGSQAAMVTMVYRALIDDGDDEDSEYQKLDPTTRDRRVLLGNGAYITLRPDMFTYLFKIMPENVINTMNEDQDNKKTWDSIKRNLGELVNANVMPQALRPFMNVMNNRDSRTGRPIVPQSVENLEIQDQYTAGTSELAKLLSENLSGDTVSPLQIDYYLRQYLGYTGGLMMMFFDTMIDELDVYDYDRATKSDRDRLASIPGMSNFISREYGNRHTTDYYELKGEVDKAYASYKFLEKNEFDAGRVEGFAKENYIIIQAKGQMNAYVTALQGIRAERRRLIKAPRTLISADEKKAVLDAFYEEERAMLREIRDLRKVIFGKKFKDPKDTYYNP